MRELLARVRAVLRRSQREEEPSASVLEDRGLRVDVQRHEVWLNGEPLDLSPKEFELLTFLMQRRGVVFTRTDLLEQVWGTLYADPRTVDVHIHWLRRKIEEDPSRPQRLLTVRGVGYKYRSE
jgi:DNA-binding response OmpR family regulator